MNDSSASLPRIDDAARASWIARAQAALDGTTPDADLDAVEVLRGQPPPLLDASGRRALIAPLLAGFLWIGAAFFEQVRGPLDSAGLLLRLLALALTTRSVLLGAEFLRRARVYLAHRRYQLALLDEGLLLRTPRADMAVEKHALIDVCPQLGSRKERGLWAPVYVVTPPQSGQLFLSLPPVFARTPALLVEHLTRWRKLPSAAGAVDSNARSPSASATGAAIEWRRGLSWRGPYATVLLGLVLLEGYFRMPAPVRAQVGGTVALIVSVCLGVVPAAWLLWTRLREGPRRDPLLIVTAADLSVRTRAGMEHVAWSSVSGIELGIRTQWSLVLGAQELRWMTIRRIGLPAIRLLETMTSTPIEVIAALCEASRTAAKP